VARLIKRNKDTNNISSEKGDITKNRKMIRPALCQYN
jgi:hypothetical protein